MKKRALINRYFFLSAVTYLGLTSYLTLFFGVSGFSLNTLLYFIQNTFLEFFVGSSIIGLLTDHFMLHEKFKDQMWFFSLIQVFNIFFCLFLTQVFHQLMSPVPFSMTIDGLVYGFQQTDINYFSLFLLITFVFSYIIDVSVKSLLHRLTFMTNKIKNS